MAYHRRHGDSMFNHDLESRVQGGIVKQLVLISETGTLYSKVEVLDGYSILNKQVWNLLSVKACTIPLADRIITNFVVSAMSSSKGESVVIDTVTELAEFLSSIVTRQGRLYIDLEGTNLSRKGTLTIITILVYPDQVVKLIDVQSLGKRAFTTPASNSTKTLKHILETPKIKKYFWDVRNDADALWAHYGVELANVIDIQLLENVSRPGNKSLLYGLARCIEKDLALEAEDKRRWLQTKKQTRALMAAGIFAVRPLAEKTAQYCVNDVLYLPQLHRLYLKRMDQSWFAKVVNESARRVADAHSPNYKTHGPQKILGPWA
jgi:exonuclease 3'-5' domain-containing protein 1